MHHYDDSRASSGMLAVATAAGDHAARRGSGRAGPETLRTSCRKSLSSFRRRTSLRSRGLQLLVAVGPVCQGAGFRWVARDASPVELPVELLDKYELMSLVLNKECVDVLDVGRVVLHEQANEAASDDMPRARVSCRRGMCNMHTREGGRCAAA